MVVSCMATFLENIWTYKGYVVSPFILFHIHKQFHLRDGFQGRFLLLHDMFLVNFYNWRNFLFICNFVLLILNQKENEAHWEPHLSISVLLYIRTYLASLCIHLSFYKLNISPRTRIFLVKCFLCPPIPSSILGFQAIRTNTRKEAMRLKFCFVNPVR